MVQNDYSILFEKYLSLSAIAILLMVLFSALIDQQLFCANCVLGSTAKTDHLLPIFHNLASCPGVGVSIYIAVEGKDYSPSIFLVQLVLSTEQLRWISSCVLSWLYSKR